MSGVNKVILVGHLGKDPDARETQAGLVVSFSLATSDGWRDKQTGERKERTEWHSIVIFNEGLAKVAQQYLKKGSKVYIEGALQTRKWQDKTGADRWTTEVVLQRYRGEMTLLDSQSNRPPPPAGQDDYGQTKGGGAAPASASAGGTPPSHLDDDIPF